jgi:hypothetical protein
MRYEIIDLQIEDIMWFGIDNNGYIFECTSGGIGNVPEFVCKSREETERLSLFFLKELTSSTEAKLLCPEADNQLVKDAKLLASKGIYCFDVTNEKPHDENYKKIAEPLKSININDLPGNIIKILLTHKVDVDLTTSNYIDVVHAYA